MIFGIEWDWSIFAIGSISTLAVKFLHYYVSRPNINWKGVLYDIIYIVFGGLFTWAMTPVNIYQAIIFGAMWEPLFKKLLKENKKDG